jgi:hypothetical protein
LTVTVEIIAEDWRTPCKGDVMSERLSSLDVSFLHREAVTIELSSYDGGIYYGLNADRDGMPEVDVLAALIEQSLTGLVAASTESTRVREPALIGAIPQP